MTRTQRSVVVYPEELNLTADAQQRLEAFELWLADELVRLESRWSVPSNPHVRRAACPVASKPSPA